MPLLTKFARISYRLVSGSRAYCSRFKRDGDESYFFDKDEYTINTKAPKTEEEIKKTAEAYEVHPKEYKTYELGGEYPKLPYIGDDSRDPNYPWDFPARRRNFNDPIQARDNELSFDLHFSYGLKQPLTNREIITYFLLIVLSVFSLSWLSLEYPRFKPVMEKQYPKPGIIHYTFESAQ